MAKSSVLQAVRLCEWCAGPLPAGCRSDARFCRTACRQAAHRFRPDRGGAVAASTPLRLAYADPPYPKQAKLYRGHPDFAGEVDHPGLVEHLMAMFPDGWALSTSSAALPAVLASCPTSVRVAAWFRGERPTRSWQPLSAWEPVVVYGGRAYLCEVDQRRADALVHVARARRSDPNRVVGAKPAAFCHWLFSLLGALPGDELHDLFPGSAGVSRAFAAYCRQPASMSQSIRRLYPNDAPGGDPMKLHVRCSVPAGFAAAALFLAGCTGGTSTPPAPAAGPAGATAPVAVGTPSGGITNAEGPYGVVQVLDAERVQVDRGVGGLTTVRLLGSVAPKATTPAACFATEAVAEAHRLLDGQKVRIVADPGSSRIDENGEPFVYAWLATGDTEGRMVNDLLVEGGYAREATGAAPYLYRSNFARAEQLARSNDRGLWSTGTCSGNIARAAS